MAQHVFPFSNCISGGKTSCLINTNFKVTLPCPCCLSSYYGDKDTNWYRVITI